MACLEKCGAWYSIHGQNVLSKESSCQYWPAVGRQAKFGEYVVELISEEALEGFTIRTISVLFKKVHADHSLVCTCY